MLSRENQGSKRERGDGGSAHVVVLGKGAVGWSFVLRGKFSMCL